MKGAAVTEADAPATRSLAHLPVGIFATVMGLAGTAIAWERATAEWEAVPIGPVFAWLGLAALAACVVAYGAKAVRHPRAVAAEWTHPVKLGFAATVAVGPLVLAGAMVDIAAGLSEVLWWCGTVSLAVITVWTLRTWIADAQIQLVHVHPAWFIPVVGNLVVPIVGVQHAPVEVSWYFFGVGLVYWLGLLPVVLSRLFVAGVVPPRLAPTLAIMIAPPAVGAVAWVSLGGSWQDPLARVLVAVTVLQVALLVAQARSLWQLPFAISSWAYTFPLASAAVATGAAADAGLGVVYAWISGAILAAVTVLVVALGARTAVAVARGELLAPEPAPPSP